ncbi:hypothetical protein DFH09DRAFT_1490614 [Mycena vulgaris]|nr:hypothetical protein DFH09DRAFT_1490614 [Mycena vulgaris]
MAGGFIFQMPAACRCGHGASSIASAAVHAPASTNSRAIPRGPRRTESALGRSLRATGSAVPRARARWVQEVDDWAARQRAKGCALGEEGTQAPAQAPSPAPLLASLWTGAPPLFVDAGDPFVQAVDFGFSARRLKMGLALRLGVWFRLGGTSQEKGAEGGRGVDCEADIGVPSSDGGKRVINDSPRPMGRATRARRIPYFSWIFILNSYKQ